MAGLLQKEWLLFRRYGIPYVVAFALFILLDAFVIRKPDSGTPVLTILLALSVFAGMREDDTCGWNTLAQTMPVSRTAVVVSKYLFGFIATATAIGLNIISIYAVSYINPSNLKVTRLGDISPIETSVLLLAYILTVYAIVFLIVFKMGTAQATAYLCVSVVVTAWALFTISDLLDASVYMRMHSEAKIKYFLAFAFVVYLLSCWRSVLAYKNREF